MGINLRGNIQSGDLLVWDGASAVGKSDTMLRLVRLFTLSNFGHLSVAWRKDGVLKHVEATEPSVRVSVVPDDVGFYHIPMGLNLIDEDMLKFYADKLGLPYSVIDAIRGYLGITLDENDDKWQCVELCNYFYQSIGLEFGNVWTPTKFVKAMMEETGSPLFRITPKN